MVPVALALVAAVLALLAAVAWRLLPKGAAKQEAAPAAAPAVPAARGARARGGMDRMREGVRRRANQAAAAPARAAGSDDDEASGSGSEDEDENQPAVHANKKERNKAAKREAAEAERAAREAKQSKASTYDERRAQKDAEREAREAAQAAEIARAAAEAQAKEDEEAAKWMGMISVENEGTGEAEVQEETQGLLGQFVGYIQARKTVPLEQLAVEFGMRTTDVIDRITRLEEMGRLTGVMDERGKYIYISMEEMKAVASFITTKGRVAIAELAAKSNTFIDLELKAEAEAIASAARPQIDFDVLLADTA